MVTLTILLLLASHLAAFFAGAHNARRAAAIKSAAGQVKAAVDATAKALRKD